MGLMLKKLFGYCPCCNRYFRWPVTRQRRASQYVNDEANFLVACKECHELDDEYFNDLWQQYYSSIW